MVEKGFITALGTPLDKEGNLIPESMAFHVESQIKAGAAALLCMGSMGQQPYITNLQYPLTARICARTVKGRIPLYVGVSDTSVKRVLERIETLHDLNIDGVVATASYYTPLSQSEIVRFFTQIADHSAYPLYLYDLPQASQVQFSAETVSALMKHLNIHGIKSANIAMLRKIMRIPGYDPGFRIFFSGLDIMDVAAGYGLPYMLDGMFACTPANSARFARCLSAGDVWGAGKILDRILLLRNTMAAYKLRPAFTYVMNLLGFPGFFFPDYSGELDDSGREALQRCMTDIGEIG